MILYVFANDLLFENDDPPEASNTTLACSNANRLLERERPDGRSEAEGGQHLREPEDGRAFVTL